MLQSLPPVEHLVNRKINNEENRLKNTQSKKFHSSITLNQFISYILQTS